MPAVLRAAVNCLISFTFVFVCLPTQQARPQEREKHTSMQNPRPSFRPGRYPIAISVSMPRGISEPICRWRVGSGILICVSRTSGNLEISSCCVPLPTHPSGREQSAHNCYDAIQGANIALPVEEAAQQSSERGGRESSRNINSNNSTAGA